MCPPDPNTPFSAKSPSAEAALSSLDDESLLALFTPLTREVEENVELYFSELAAASDTYTGELFDDDTHSSFYLASKEVISQGLRTQLDFLRDNAPKAFAILVRRTQTGA